jgi:hypothetical protein
VRGDFVGVVHVTLNVESLGDWLYTYCLVGHCDVWKLLLQGCQEKKARSINSVLVPAFFKRDTSHCSYLYVMSFGVVGWLIDMDVVGEYVWSDSPTDSFHGQHLSWCSLGVHCLA